MTRVIFKAFLLCLGIFGGTYTFTLGHPWLGLLTAAFCGLIYVEIDRS